MTRPFSCSVVAKLRAGGRLYVRRLGGGAGPPMLLVRVVDADGAGWPDVPVTEVLAALRTPGVEERPGRGGDRCFVWGGAAPGGATTWTADDEREHRKDHPSPETPKTMNPTPLSGRSCRLPYGAALKQSELLAALGYSGASFTKPIKAGLDGRDIQGRLVSESNPRMGRLFDVDMALVAALREMGAEVSTYGPDDEGEAAPPAPAEDVGGSVEVVIDDGSEPAELPPPGDGGGAGDDREAELAALRASIPRHVPVAAADFVTEARCLVTLFTPAAVALREVGDDDLANGMNYLELHVRALLEDALAAMRVDD